MTASVIAPPASLSYCEEVIERGLRSFTEVGLALMTIRDGRLYRASYPTFEAYCANRWGFSRVRAHQLIEGADITRALTAVNSPAPVNEAQARELNGLEPEVAAEVMRQAIDATDGKPTAPVLREVRDRIAPKPVSPAPAAVWTSATEALASYEPAHVAQPAEPAQPRRRPLTDGFRDASLDLSKLITRIENLVSDDRFARNKNEVARYANDLIRARDALQRVIDHMS